MKLNRPDQQLPGKLRALRESNGYTVRALAQRVGVSSVTIWKWENGSCKPSARSIFSLAKALDLPPTALEFVTNTPNDKNKEHIIQDDGGEPLPDVIAKAKQMIAEASGLNPDNVKIIIEY